MNARESLDGESAGGAIAGAAVALRQDFVRDVNDNLARGLPYQDGDEIAVLCECGRRDCSEWVTLTSHLFRLVRRRPGWYIVRDGHGGDVVPVRARRGAFAIVESRVAPWIERGAMSSSDETQGQGGTSGQESGGASTGSTGSEGTQSEGSETGGSQTGGTESGGSQAGGSQSGTSIDPTQTSQPGSEQSAGSSGSEESGDQPA